MPCSTSRGPCSGPCWTCRPSRAPCCCRPWPPGGTTAARPRPPPSRCSATPTPSASGCGSWNRARAGPCLTRGPRPSCSSRCKRSRCCRRPDRPGSIRRGVASVVGPVRDNGYMQLYRDDGVVLRTQKLGEADHIVTVLARKTGKVRAVAKGVRRTKSRFGGRLEPFTHVDLLLYTGRSLDVITQAETLRPYGAQLASDYPRYTTGTAMLETADRFTPEEKEPTLRQ